MIDWSKVKVNREREKRDQIEEIVREAEYIALKDDLKIKNRGMQEFILENLR